MRLVRLTRISLLFAVVILAGFATRGQVDDVGADDPIRFGNPAASIKIEVFLDFQCPSCAEYNKRLQVLKTKYQEKAHIVYRHFPLPMHDKAMIAARAVEAARSQGKALEMIDLIFTNQKQWTGDPKVKMFAGYAGKLGLDRVRFREDFNSAETLRRIEQDIGRAKFLKIGSTPSVLVNDKLVSYIESLDIERIVSESVN